MSAEGNIYQSARLAYGYAHHRPPVHREIIRQMREHLRLVEHCERALDIGCGAGLSTAALEPLALNTYGIEPVSAMLTHHQDVSATSNFAVARAECLPYADQSFDLMTAAGSLNYADLSRFFPEARRVLRVGGLLAIYDFSAGRRLADDPRLENWYESFQARYPFPPGYALDVQTLPLSQYGLSLHAYHTMEVRVALNFTAYVDYALSETSVELALAGGLAEADIRAWCERTLAEIFLPGPREVCFDAYVAYVKKAGTPAEAQE